MWVEQYFTFEEHKNIIRCINNQIMESIFFIFSSLTVWKVIFEYGVTRYDVGRFFIFNSIHDFLKTVSRGISKSMDYCYSHVSLNLLFWVSLRLVAKTKIIEQIKWPYKIVTKTTALVRVPCYVSKLSGLRVRFPLRMNIFMCTNISLQLGCLSLCALIPSHRSSESLLSFRSQLLS